MIIQSSVYASLKRRKLLKGFFLSFLFFVALLVGSLLTPLSFLHKFGLILPLGTIISTHFVMREYNRLRRCEKNPYTLCFSKEALVLTSKRKAHFLLPCALIESLKFVNRSNEYGIAIWLSVPWEEHLFLKGHSNSLVYFHKKGQKYAADLFLPFFTKESCLRLQKILLTKPVLNNVMHTDDSHNL